MNLVYTGTAIDGTDFTGLAQTTILSGSTTGTFTLDTTNDSLFETAESFDVTIDSATGGGFTTITPVGGSDSVTTTITDDDTPTLSVSNPAITEEVDGFAEFTVSLSNLSTEDVSFTLSLADGTATGTGTDYGTAGADNIQVFVGATWTDATSATILAGDSSIQVRTAIVDDVFADDGETFTLTAAVSAGTTTNASAFGTATISDEPTPDNAFVSISGPASVAEGATTTNYTVSVDQAPSVDLTVNFTYSGTAFDGTDFTGMASATILVGNTTASFTLDTLTDTIAESAESIIIDIDSFSGGGFESVQEHATNNQVTTSITDDDSASWSLTGDASVSESTNASYAITLTGTFGAGETAQVTLTQSDIDTVASDLGAAGSANQDDVYAAITTAVAGYSGQGTLGFNAGSGILTYTATSDGDQMSALNFSVLATEDSTQEAGEDYTISISTPASSTGANVVLGGSTAVTTTITDNDSATVSIAATKRGSIAAIFSPAR